MTRIGLIFHWGLYSVPAYDSVTSAKRRTIQNGSEWYAKRLMVKEGDYRPIAGWRETQKFHRENFSNEEYEIFVNNFTAENVDFDEWMRLCKSIGGSYVILTAKHHEGFCLFETKTTDYNFFHSAARRDLVKEFSQAAKRHGLMFGIYYSWCEFGKGCTKKFMDDIVIPQCRELLQQYHPEIWWFDGDWECKTKYCLEKIGQIIKEIRKDNRDVQINNRLGKNNLICQGNFTSFERCFPPRKQPSWEYITTIGFSWGRNQDQNKIHYKHGRTLYELFEKAKGLDADWFTLNVGPNADGTLDPMEMKRLEEFGKQIRLYRKYYLHDSDKENDEESE